MGKKLILIIFLGLALRLININQSLWLDEAIGAIAARDFTYSEILKNFIVVDNHTPGYYLLLKFWAGIFGYSEFTLRGLSVVFGILTIFVTFKIAELVSKSKTIAIFASLLLATSQIYVYYSQEARMYAMAGFFAALAVLYFIKVLDKDRNMDWVVFSASILGTMLSDYMPVFLLPLFPVYVLVKKRKVLIKLLISFIPLSVFGVFWMPIAKIQIMNYSIVPDTFLFGGATFKQLALLWMKFVFGRVTFEPKFAYYLLVALVSIPVIISLITSLKKRNLLIWLWVLMPLAGGFMASFIFPAFSYFRYIYILPAFYILISLGNKKPLIYLVLAFNLISLLIYYSDQKQQREQWREAVNYIESQSPENAIALFEFPEPFAPYRWYETGKVEAIGVTNAILADTSATQEKTLNLIRDKEKLYYFEYLADVSDPSRVVVKVINENGFIETSKTTKFIGVGAISVYEKVN